MTGTVHFDPSTDTSSRQNLRPSLLRPVSMEEADNSMNEIHESLPRKAAVRLYRQISSGFNSRTIRCLLVVSLGLNLIFAVLVGIFVGFWQSSRLTFDTESGVNDEELKVPTAQQLYSCFSCPEKGIPGLDLSVAVRSQNGVCCTTDDVPGLARSNKLLELTRDYVRAYCPPSSGEWGASDQGRPGRPQSIAPPSAAHLTMDVMKSKENLHTMPANKHYLSWNVQDDAGASFISEDLHYVNGTITISSNGRYHVYAHLTFDTASNNLQGGLKQLVVDNSITRISRGSTVHLLLDRISLRQREIKSSDLEGTFELRKGDVIKVIVSFPTYLYKLSHTNVFGLFKLVSG